MRSGLLIALSSPSRAQQHLFGIGKRELRARESILRGEAARGFAHIDRQP
jgi:hypothetical protein